jgi:hypothetical protein
MSQRYQLILHASGLHVPEEGQDPIIGFVTVRRVMAMNPEDAAEQAKEELLNDPKILSMIEQTRLSTGTDETCKVEVDECFPIGWLRWTFSSLPTRLLLYSAEKDGGESAE